jgi:tRNA A-37 threonylcarbamoyl transferase component Bud32
MHPGSKPKSVCVNDTAACAADVRRFVEGGDYLAERFGPEVLQETETTRVTKLTVPGCGVCVLKERFVPRDAGLPKRLRQWWRIRIKQKFLRTFTVTLAARRAGVRAYEPYAVWVAGKGFAAREYFLCNFVEGASFAALCKDMHYGEAERGAVLAYFTMLGESAAMLHGNGIVNPDIIPQNCIIPKEADGRPPLVLIDFDLAFFTARHGRRFVFLQQMRSFRRIVSHYPFNEECLEAFLGAYAGGDSAKVARCREVLEFFRKHSGHCSFASLYVWLRYPPVAGRQNG